MNQYPYPTYQEELENERLQKMMDVLRQQNESLKKQLAEERKNVEKERIEKLELKKKYHNREFTTATKIKKIYKQLYQEDYQEGLVITPPIKYVTESSRQRRDISTFNWVYSQNLGLIRSINEQGIVEMDLGRFYYFKTNDGRKAKHYRQSRENGTAVPMTHMEAVRAVKSKLQRQKRKTEIIDGKLVISVSFQIDACLLYSSVPVYLEDKYLNRVHLNTKMIGQIFKLANSTKLEGSIWFETRVILKAKFLERFQRNENDAIFEIMPRESTAKNKQKFQLAKARKSFQTVQQEKREEELIRQNLELRSHLNKATLEVEKLAKLLEKQKETAESSNSVLLRQCEVNSTEMAGQNLFLLQVLSSEVGDSSSWDGM